MALPKKLQIKESISTLRAHQRKSGELIAKRMQVLIVIKQHEQTGISKRDISDLTGVNHNSIVKWRNMYEKEGLEPLLSHGRVGFKKSIITPEEHKAIEKKLNDPTNGISGYVALQQWVKEELQKDMQYITLLKYVQRHFGAKIKTARKSHIKKNEQAVEAFKKTSRINVQK